MNQLSASEEVRPLETKRKLDFRENVGEVLETNPNNKVGLGLSMMASYIGGAIKRTVTRKKTRVFTGLMDGEQIAKLKADAQSRGTVPFVSTNDIITSAFANATAAHTCLMALDLRGRMNGLTEDHAGNYAKSLMFDS